jgi:hypothetical protein
MAWFHKDLKREQTKLLKKNQGPPDKNEKRFHKWHG